MEAENKLAEKQAGYYYPLFKFFNEEHNLILLDSEIQEIIHEVQKFVSPKRSDSEMTLEQKYGFSEIELQRAYRDIEAYKMRIRILSELLEKANPQPPMRADFELLWEDEKTGKKDVPVQSGNSTFQEKYYEMEDAINKEMELWDLEKRIKVAQSIEDLRKFIITA